MEEIKIREQMPEKAIKQMKRLEGKIYNEERVYPSETEEKFLELVKQGLTYNEAWNYMLNEEIEKTRIEYAKEFNEAKETGKKVQFKVIKIRERVPECDISFKIFYAMPDGEIQIIYRDMY